MKKPKNRIPLHPFLFGAYPVLALLATNVDEVGLSPGVRPLIFCLLLAGLLLGVLKLLLKDWQRAGLIATLLLALFFSYGHVYRALADVHLFGVLIGRHRVLAVAWVVIFGVGLWLILRRAKALENVTSGLNVIGALLLILPVLQIGAYQYNAWTNQGQTQTTAVDIENLSVPEGETPPDIYYIILDGYSRADVIAEHFDLDNTPFIEALADLGFYTAECSRSNYAQTRLSLSSSLNMSYVDTLLEGIEVKGTHTKELNSFIRDSAVRQALENLGYQIVAFETGFNWTQLEDADLYLSPNLGVFGQMRLLGGLSNFESLLIQTTAFLFLDDAGRVLPSALFPDIYSPYEIKREQVLFTLDQLEQLPEVAGPKFVFAHVLIPHDPHVFGPEGEAVLEVDDPIKGYHDQVLYANSRILMLVEKLIEDSARPPIIILQGDHGGLQAPALRMPIFNSYYLPDGGSQALYAGISPVNSFRVVFNQYFGGDYELLDDLSYYSKYDLPYDFELVPEIQAACTPE